MSTTTAEKIAVMQAFEDGKVIEYKLRDYFVWGKTQSPAWDWDRFEYRVAKPVPKKVKMWPAVYRNNGTLNYGMSSYLYPTEEAAKAAFGGDCFVRLATEYPPIEIEVTE